MIPDNVEKIIMTKEDYDRNVEQLLVEKLELQQELQRKDNIINELKKWVGNELPYLYEIDKEYENIEGNTYFTYKEYDYKKILDKIKELESK